MTDPWNYRAIVGMLLYLSNNTRSDLAYSVSQVARFAADPKQSHATAVKTILRYLKKTENHGTIVRPTKHLQLDNFCDADFCGLADSEDERDPNCVRSRTGYVILLSGWPLVWKSQLQSHISLSTLEAEYSALSYSLKTLIPLKRIIVEMIKMIDSSPLEDTTVRATVFEDNMGAYYLATNQRITNRTRYMKLKWNWFWAMYNEGLEDQKNGGSEGFRIVKCPTDEQLADMFTKQLPRDAFERNRRGVIGW